MLVVNNNCHPVPIDPPCDQDVALVTCYLCPGTATYLCRGTAIYSQLSTVLVQTAQNREGKTDTHNNEFGLSGIVSRVNNMASLIATTRFDTIAFIYLIFFLILLYPFIENIYLSKIGSGNNILVNRSSNSCCVSLQNCVLKAVAN